MNRACEWTLRSLLLENLLLCELAADNKTLSTFPSLSYVLQEFNEELERCPWILVIWKFSCFLLSTRRLVSTKEKTPNKKRITNSQNQSSMDISFNQWTQLLLHNLLRKAAVDLLFCNSLVQLSELTTQTLRIIDLSCDFWILNLLSFSLKNMKSY